MVVKTKEEARANFENSIGYIPARYQAGVQKADWLTPAKSDVAEKNYADGVGKAVQNKTRQKKIASLSNEDWRNASIAKGVPIIGDRLRNAMDKWSSNFNPIYDQVISKVASLPPRTTDFRNNINTRLVPIVETWKRASGKA